MGRVILGGGARANWVSPSSIFVTGLSETDTVSAEKDGHIVQGKWADEGFLIYPIKKYGTWTVTATNGEKTSKQNIVIETTGIYTVEMDYYFYLIKKGQLNSEIEFKTAQSNGRGVISYNSDNVHLSLPARGDTQGNAFQIYTGSLDLSDFSKAYIRCSYANCFRYNRAHTDGFGFTLGDTWSQDATTMNRYVLFENDATDVILSLDISDITAGVCRIILENQSKHFTGNTSPNEVWIYDVWFE